MCAGAHREAQAAYEIASRSMGRSVMNRIWAVGIALALAAALPPLESVPAEAKTKAKANSTSSAKPSAGQKNKKVNSLYFPESMLEGKKHHPDFIWLPK